MEKTHRQIPIKTSLGTFQFEFSTKGLYAVRFPPKISGTTTPARWGGFGRRRWKLDLTGYRPFQRRVYAVLWKIPAGKTITYGELAKRAGYPGAGRAVGSAMKKNRFPVVIPCHRVVPRAGGIGEYSVGVKWKRLLLECEKIAHRTTRKAQR
jgi:O-6-methylguanine DNA methyltransferase